MWHDSFIYVTWLIHICDMTYSYMWHASFIYVTWLIHICDMTHLYMWHDSFIYVTWLIHTYDMTHSYMWHDSFIYVTWLSYGWSIHMCAMILDGILIHMCAMKLSLEYGVATICRLLKIIGLFCKKALLKRLYSAKKTDHFQEAY